MTSVKSSQQHDAVTTFEMQAPSWRPRLHPGSHALGEPDIYVRSDDDPVAPEDEMSEVNVKNGLNARPAVGNETFSAHDMIYDRLKGKMVMQHLGSLFDEVTQRRSQLASLRCGPAPSQYRHPQRVTLNEVKLAAYIKELADPTVPLRKLAKSVPHGYRGERMLDMLWNGGSLASAISAVKVKSSVSNVGGSPSTTVGDPSRGGVSHTSVAIDRAVWFVRVVGASEISSSRLRQGNSAAYTAEWTGVLMAWLRRQIVELNIVHQHQISVTGSPTASSPLSSSKMRSVASMPSPLVSTPHLSEEPYALILEDDFCQRWTAKWEYGLSLLQALIYENLIDEQVAARAAIDMLRTANIVQVFIALSLVAQFAGVIIQSATLNYLAVDVLCNKLVDYGTAASASGATLIKEMRTVLVYCIAHAPDALLAPNSLSKIVNDQCLLDEINKLGLSQEVVSSKQRVASLLDGFSSKLDGIGAGVRPFNGQLHVVNSLDKFPTHLSVDEVFFAVFKQDERDRLTAKEKVRLLMTWATTEWRFGTHRPYLVARLLLMYTERQHSQRKRRKNFVNGVETSLSNLEKLDLDALITAWVTEVDSAQHGLEGKRRQSSTLVDVSIDALTVLLGELCRLQIFSFQKYLRRLTARGLTVMGGREERAEAGESSASANVTTGDGAKTPEDSHTISDSIHSKLLRNVPLFPASSALEHQRRIAIYGNRTKESYEEAVLRRAWRELYSQMTWLFSPMDDGEGVSLQPLNLVRFASSSRYVRLRIVQAHVQPMIRQFVEQSAITVEQFQQVVSVYEEAQDYAAMADFLKMCSASISKRQMIAGHGQKLKLALDECKLRHRSLLLAIDIDVAVTTTQGEASPNMQDKKEVKIGDIETLNRSLQSFFQNSSDSVIDESTAQLSFTPAQILDILSHSDETRSNRIARWVQALLKLGCLNGKELETALLSHMSSSDQLRRLLFSFWQFGMISLDAILKSSIVTLLSDEALDVQEPTQSTISFVLPVLEQIFVGDDLANDDRLASSSSLYAELQRPSTLTLLLCLLCWLVRAAIVDPQHCDRMQAVQNRIAEFSEVRQFVQSKLAWFVQLARQTLSIDHISTLMNQLLPQPWAADKARMSIAYAVQLCEDVDCFKWEQRLGEIVMMIDDMQDDKSTPLAQRNSQLEKFARSMVTGMLGKVSGVAAQRCVETILTVRRTNEPNSFHIIAALLEAQLQSINKHMEATFVDEDQLRSAARTASELLQYAKDVHINIANTVAQCFRLVTEWFESKLDATAENALLVEMPTELSAATASHQQARKAQTSATYVRLSIICSLLRLPGVLSAQTLRALAARTFSAIARIVISMGTADQDSNVESDGPDHGRPTNIKADMTDVLTYMLQQAPAEVQQTMQARAAEHASATLSSPWSTADVGIVRIAWLVNLDNDAVRSARSHLFANSGATNSPRSSSHKRATLVEGQSNTSALANGNFVPITLKAWEMHPNVEMLSSVAFAGTEPASHAEHSKTEIKTLTNNGPISLHHFGAYRTLDRMLDLSGYSHSAEATASDDQQSAAPTTLTSEQSYGLHMAGQPVYARDARRGLLALWPSEHARFEAKHLVPALATPPPVNSTPQTSNSTPKKVTMDESKELSALKAIATGTEEGKTEAMSRKRRKADNGKDAGVSAGIDRSNGGEGGGRKRAKK